MILRLATRAMGTRFELVLIGRDEVRLRAAGEEALAEIEECDRRLSLFRRDSVVSHVNRGAAVAWIPVDVDTFDLLARCAGLHAASGGAFDPTISPLMEVHGFRGTGAAPDLQTARRAVGWDKIALDPDRRSVRFHHPGTALDLGAVGKGHGLDRAAAALRQAGVTVGLLHGGTSTAVALAAPVGSGGWRVSLGQRPGAPVAVLEDCALSVSAQSGPMAASRPGHVLDPRSGAPASGPCVAAVIAENATDADAWSTALLVGDELPGSMEVITADRDGEELIWRDPVAAPGRFSLNGPRARQ